MQESEQNFGGPQGTPNVCGYREVEHTADWELEVWAPDLARLFEEAARGMYALTGIRLATSPRYERQLALEAGDDESLLVNFLSELLYYAETEALAFDVVRVQVEDGALAADLRGAPIEEYAKEIKAVTYHKLKVQRLPDGLQVRVVFDV
jgi:SHS2 domain-containing protein